MRGVESTPRRGIARAEAGVLWMEVTHRAAEFGLAALAGSSPDVGVVGYSLGGGVGWLARKHGIAANSVVAAEIVTADGRCCCASTPTTSPTLFWAIRGGGGSFGVVTALEFRLYPVAEVYAGALFFPMERAARCCRPGASGRRPSREDVTSTVRVMQFPPHPRHPRAAPRASAFAIVEATYAGDERRGRAHGRAAARARPVDGHLRDDPRPRAAAPAHGPRPPGARRADGMLLAELTAETVDALVGVAGADSGSPLLSVEIRHLGGAVGRPAPGGGALASIDAPFAMFAVGMASTRP